MERFQVPLAACVCWMSVRVRFQYRPILVVLLGDHVHQRLPGDGVDETGIELAKAVEVRRALLCRQEAPMVMAARPAAAKCAARLIAVAG